MSAPSLGYALMESGLPLHGKMGDPKLAYEYAASLSLPLALGYMTDVQVKACLLLQAIRRAPDRSSEDLARRLWWTCSDTANAIAASRSTGERRIRWETKALFERRAPGTEILGAASRVRGPHLRDYEVTAICRDIAQQARRRHGV